MWRPLAEAHGALGWALADVRAEEAARVPGLPWKEPPLGELHTKDADALRAAWREGAVLTPALLAAIEGRSPQAWHGWEVTPGVRVLPIRTPTLPPATHTNAFLLGTRDLLYVEPCATDAGERTRARAFVDHHLERTGGALTGVALTHHHVDHAGDVALAAERGVPLLGHPWNAGPLDAPLQPIDEGHVLELGALEVRCWHTPGHAPGHLCFLARHRETGREIGIVGDMVAGVGTILVEPNGGDMRAYLAQLARLEARALDGALPAHGGFLAEPARVFAHYQQHRLAREAKVLAALQEAGEGSAADLVPVAYDDAPKAVWPLATLSVEAHLLKLEVEGRVRQHDRVWRPC